MPFPAIIPQLPDRKWNISIFIIELFLFAPLLHYFPYDHLPAPGWAVAFIAVAAALMSIHDKMTGVQRAGWMLLIAFLLVIELRAISKDRSINEEAQKTDREEERRSFQNLLKQEASNNHDLLQFADERFLQITNTQQKGFSQTMHNFAAAQQSNNKRFTGVLEKEQELYAHEEALADGQTGTLTPSDIPTPVNACTSKGKIPKGATLVLIEDNAYWFTRFPHVILESMSKGPIVSIEKTQTNQLAVIFDLRSADGKVIAQMNADGYVINRNNTLQIKKSKSELSVIDLFGSNVLNVKYLNPQVISVTGIPTPSSLHDSCSGEAGRTDILIR